MIELPVRPDGFLADHAVTAPWLTVDGSREETLAGALAALAPADDPEAEAGWAAFTDECAQSALVERLTPPHRVRPPARGFAGLLHHEVVAARREHPVHPTGRCRWGMSEAEQRAYAPEHEPVFPVRWRAVHRSRLRFGPDFTRPDWWPPADRADEFLLPVHPLTAARGAPTLDRAGPLVAPTLSVRTVAVLGEPGTHLKLPMPTATLGSRNSRTIKPGTLADGDAVHRLLAQVLDREPELAATVVLADESSWVDSDDELLAALVRRYPADVADDELVPVAALLAPDPYGRAPRVLDRLAEGVDWFDRYVTTLLDWHIALWLRYGIALEAHQQNITVAQSGPRLRLVYKDDDGARIDTAKLSAALGTTVSTTDFADRRMAVTDPGELADVVVTITLHLCVGALVFDETGPRRAELLDLVRTRLVEALCRWGDDGSVRTALLAADRLPVKAMVTAGTLLPKQRLGCADVNKYYLRTGPNYLKRSSS